MCGIFCQLGRKTQAPCPALDAALRGRGPDAYGELTVPLEHHGLQLRFVSTVLALRGREVVKQPLQDPGSGSVLCWNGEAWRLQGQYVNDNDTRAIFEFLLESTRPVNGKVNQENVITAVLGVLSHICGPFAFVFFHAETRLLFHGRDCLGRRSLVHCQNSGSWTVTSICGPTSPPQKWSEVEADGVYVTDLTKATDTHRDSSPHLVFEPATRRFAHLHVFPGLNQSLPISVPTELPNSAVNALGQALRAAVAIRVMDIRPSTPVQSDPSIGSNASQVAILFSGGLDCSLLARIMHDALPTAIHVDLLNVAFENPRIHKGGSETSPYELCPDRVTARKSFAELQAVCPDRRWNLVEIDIPFNELMEHRQRVVDLMHPHNTEMDLSIAIALYFAARGTGCLNTANGRQRYVSPSRVLLSGLGADELFAGYQRHSTAFARCGFLGLLDELQLDFGRLGKRNLGRDDRVISHWGKEVRFPYLDEDVVSWALSAPVWEKCGFGLVPPTHGTPSTLDAEKRVLRLLAQSLGLQGIAVEKKRAIQFGTRSAKMETGKVKGTQPLSQTTEGVATRGAQAVSTT